MKRFEVVFDIIGIIGADVCMCACARVCVRDFAIVANSLGLNMDGWD